MPESVRRERADGRAPARCGACAHVFTEPEWLGLPVLDKLEPAAIAEYVVGWPVTQSIEVRGCSACGGGVARTERRPATTGDVDGRAAGSRAHRSRT